MTEKNKAIRAQQLKLRSELWPTVAITHIWDRKKRVGFATLPRTMPIVMAIMDSLSPRRPVSTVYLSIWCRCFDEQFLAIYNKTHELAIESGFSGQRSVQTLQGRLDILANLGFLIFAPGPAGKRSYALLFNPFYVLLKHKKKIDLTLWNALRQRMSEIKATDLDEEEIATSKSLPS